MEGLSNGQLAGIILAIGLVTVFAVLVCLILIIKLYSAVIHSAQKKQQVQKEMPVPAAEVSVQESAAALAPAAVKEEIPAEVVAAISAAVYTLYGEETPILSVRRSVRTGGRCAWGQAGVLNNTRPF